MQVLMMLKRIHLIVENLKCEGSQGVFKVSKGFTEIVENLEWVA